MWSVQSRVLGVKCKVYSGVKCGVLKCGVQSVDCRVWIADVECQLSTVMWSVECGMACGMFSVIVESVEGRVGSFESRLLE